MIYEWERHGASLGGYSADQLQNLKTSIIEQLQCPDEDEQVLFKRVLMYFFRIVLFKEPQKTIEICDCFTGELSIMFKPIKLAAQVLLEMGPGYAIRTSDEFELAKSFCSVRAMTREPDFMRNVTALTLIECSKK